MAVAIVQARVGSTRLPGKVLRPLHGRPVLSWVLRAAREAFPHGEVLVATTTEPDDDAVAALSAGEGVACVRGPVDDVLTRFVLALDGRPADTTVVRLTADCPLLDPVVVRMAVAAFEAGDVDYLSTVNPRSLPRGLDVEVTSVAALTRADERATGADRAHVTSYLYRHPDEFRLASLVFEPPADDLRVTLDTDDDARLLDALAAELGDRPPSWREVVALLRARPDLVAINAQVRQKEIDAG